ncbi:hypothetical protein CXP39_03765 [Mesoplasma syrphidae]|uniref:VOC domain-containing protein n=1 Tax=Mesoplasma syrphidae TaxID=225999 RepID=A0A2K9BSA3_9MOLU|nr:hypothetical protein [Mesoplasma syrphidae]AUF83882.1 hypothetical protein CXP39_03765 [Mesoplasma syrphidae]
MMLNHVEIYVNDLKEEHQFWSKILDLLELKILDTWKTGFSIGTSKSYISFNQSYTKSSHQFKRTNQGLNHICLLSFKDKNWILSELAKRNIKILYRNKVISEDTVFIENSWGLKIELLFVNESKKISP